MLCTFLSMKYIQTNASDNDVKVHIQYPMACTKQKHKMGLFMYDLQKSEKAISASPAMK